MGKGKVIGLFGTMAAGVLGAGLLVNSAVNDTKARLGWGDQTQEVQVSDRLNNLQGNQLVEEATGKIYQIGNLIDNIQRSNKYEADAAHARDVNEITQAIRSAGRFGSSINEIVDDNNRKRNPSNRDVRNVIVDGGNFVVDVPDALEKTQVDPRSVAQLQKFQRELQSTVDDAVEDYKITPLESSAIRLGIAQANGILKSSGSYSSGNVPMVINYGRR